MGYAVKPAKSRHRSWKLLFETRKKINGKMERRAPAIPTEKLGLHGFHTGMSIDEARDKASKLNADAELKRHAERKVTITEQMAEAALRDALTVPDEDAFKTWCNTEHRIELVGTKLAHHWTAAKRVIKSLGVLPPDYFESRRKIYRYFADEELSVEYLKKVLRFVNLYGKYYARTYRLYFEDVPYPSGRDREEINDAFFDSGKRSKAALPLTPELLAGAASGMAPEHYRWLYLSFWLGLRPLEVDALKDPQRFKVTRDKNVTVLHVYQSKLKGIARDKRWKLIPLVEPEQKAIPVILKEEFKRPLVKTIAHWFGIGHNTYSGRKGFESVMRERGWAFDAVSAWLGHQSLDRTWKSYTDRSRVRLNRTG